MGRKTRSGSVGVVTFVDFIDPQVFESMTLEQRVAELAQRHDAREAAAYVPVKLNVGCGPVRIPGEIGVDMDPNASACDVQGDVLNIPYEANTVDQVRLSHVLEHLPYRMAPTAILESRRVLKSGGVLIIGVPDMAATCAAWLACKNEPYPSSAKQIVLRHMFGSQSHDGQEHRSGFDIESLFQLLVDCGFIDVNVRQDTERGDLIETLLATAVKR